jgi:hypothetical protein
MTREDLIDVLVEVFDDTYGKTITRSGKDQKTKEIVNKARSLKANQAIAKKRFMTDRSKQKAYGRSIEHIARKYGKTA